MKDEKSSSKEKISHLRLPEVEEVFGFVEEALGSNHLEVRCRDGRTRVCRIPGRMQKRTWIDEGDVVLVEPWQVQSDEKGDVVHRYTKKQAEWLSRKGIPTGEPE